MITTVKKLKNGLPVIFVDTEAFPSVTTMILVGAGSRFETPENNGIAHFFEHMAFKGSKKYPTAFDISSKIEGLGGAFNAFTAKDHTGYYVKAPVSHFSEVADVLSDMLLHSTLDQGEIDREKNVIVEEINMYEDMPSRKVSDVFDEMIFAGHPLSYDIAGSEKTVRSFTRKTFTDYIDELYHPNNAVVIVAGGLDTKTVGIEKYLGIIEEKFGSWDKTGKTKQNPFVSKQQKPSIIVRYKKTEQAHFCLGYRAFPFSDPRRHALTVLSGILGGGMSSRLFIEVRERRGLCYYVSTGRELYEDTGYMVTQAGVTNNISQVNEAIEVILKEHNKIAKGDVSKEELVKAKELLKGRLLLSLEDSYRVASLQGSRYLFENHTIEPEEIIALIDKVTGEEITAVASDLFREDRLNIALIGPYHKKDITI
ncbi:insulinase family protein [Candidatus Roizmanbacteria bacterium]|nr:MAG: insulinase family protein [Candidatus Roizmanbacteria bacterium]